METCRTCARCDFEDETKWFDLFHSTRYQGEIEEIRNEFNNWQLHISPNDGLPQKICSDCFSKFCNVYTFRLECQTAQVKLSNIFDKIETQSIDDMENNLEKMDTQLFQIESVPPAKNKKNYQTADCNVELLKILNGAKENFATKGNAKNEVSVSRTGANIPIETFAAIKTYTAKPHLVAEMREKHDYIKDSNFAKLEVTATENILEGQQMHNRVDDLIEENFTGDGTANVDFQSDGESVPQNFAVSTTDNSDDNEQYNGNNVDAFAKHLKIEDNVVFSIVDDAAMLEDVTIKNRHNAFASIFDTAGENCKADAGDTTDHGILEAFEPVTVFRTNICNINNNNKPPITNVKLPTANAGPADFTSNELLDTTEISIAFQCKYCYRTKDMHTEHFLSQQSLLEHITIAHDADYPFTCPQIGCREGFRDAASRTVHMKSKHVAKHYVCDVCGKKYADRFNLRHHHEKFHSDTDFECATCGKRFYSRKSLNYHMKWHNPELLLHCSQCDRLFINQRHLKCHEETHNGVRNCECCTFCGKTFIHLKTLRWHLFRQHGGEKPYKCGNCTEAFASYLEKRIHMLDNHLENLTSNERTECMLCHQHFNDEHELSDHIRGEHIERPKSATLIIANNKRMVRNKRQKCYSGIFQCEMCAQRFNMKSALERHVAVHSAVGRPHKCPIDSCAKRFKRAQDMNWHMKTHSNEKPNVCDVCGKGFALKYVLNQHKRSHEVLEKNFKCVTCGRTYLFEKSLRVHERVHTGKTYYKCDLCGENFVTHMKFKSHMMKMHDPGTTNIKDYLLDEFAMP